MEQEMSNKKNELLNISPWWKHSVILVMIVGFSVLIWMSYRAYKDGPPIPIKVVDQSGNTLFTKEDIQAGQQIFLKYALMQNGTIWGHGSYLGPDYSAEYLHSLSEESDEIIAMQRYNTGFAKIDKVKQMGVQGEVAELLKENRYDYITGSLTFIEPEVVSYKKQIGKWTTFFNKPTFNMGLTQNYISDPIELRNLTAFFAWTAWSSVANRFGKAYSYTNNFPYDPTVGNTPPRDVLIWSALSIIGLLAGCGAIFFAFGKFTYLGWHRQIEEPPTITPGIANISQRAIIKYFLVVVLLLLTQVLFGGVTAHYRADPGSFYGFDLSGFLPSNITRTWHLQLAIFWIATAFMAGGLMLSSYIGTKESRWQKMGINLLFGALIVVVVGSLTGEILGINNYFGKFWFWFGHQGWEFIELGRFWQILLVVGFLLWAVLLFNGIGSARKDPDTSEISSLFLYSALAIPVFYLPAFFFNSTSHLTVAETWRFWIIHLWVEGFFELFVTVMVAIIFYKLALVKKDNAIKIIYMDAILYLSGGIIGIAHHWYWTGQSSAVMALGAVFSALEVIPLTLLTLDAWAFVKTTRVRDDIHVPHKWTFYFLMAVGFWNFVGAGIFGFLINLPIVSYFEAGTMLTANHGHAALMGVFGMLAIALTVFSLRQVLTNKEWVQPEKYIRVGFFGLNVGLFMMVFLGLFPSGIVQLVDVLNNGYWHARRPEFLSSGLINSLEWYNIISHAVFILLGVVPMVIATALTYKIILKAHS